MMPRKSVMWGVVAGVLAMILTAIAASHANQQTSRKMYGYGMYIDLTTGTPRIGGIECATNVYDLGLRVGDEIMSVVGTDRDGSRANWQTLGRLTLNANRLPTITVVTAGPGDRPDTRVAELRGQLVSGDYAAQCR